MCGGSMDRLWTGGTATIGSGVGGSWTVASGSISAREGSSRAGAEERVARGNVTNGSRTGTSSIGVVRSLCAPSPEGKSGNTTVGDAGAIFAAIGDTVDDGRDHASG